MERTVQVLPAADMYWTIAYFDLDAKSLLKPSIPPSGFSRLGFLFSADAIPSFDSPDGNIGLITQPSLSTMFSGSGTESIVISSDDPNSFTKSYPDD